MDAASTLCRYSPSATNPSTIQVDPADEDGALVVVGGGDVGDSGASEGIVAVGSGASAVGVGERAAGVAVGGGGVALGDAGVDGDAHPIIASRPSARVIDREIDISLI